MNQPIHVRGIGIAAAICTVLVGLFVLQTWAFEEWDRGTFGPNQAPMAPVTAVLFVLAGSASAMRAGWPASRRSRYFSVLAAALIAAAAGFVFAERYLGYPVPWGDWMVGGNQYFESLPFVLGKMSPITAGVFLLFLAGLLEQSLGPSSQRRHRLLTIAPAVAGLVFCASVALGYAMGLQALVYHAAIPMAPLTALTFCGLFTSNLLDRADVIQRQTQGRFDAVFQESPLGMALVDSQTGKFVHVNRRYAEILDRSTEELERLDWMAITHPEDRAAEGEQVAALIGGQSSGYRREYRCVLPGGKEIWVSLTVQALRNEEDGRSRYLAIIDDISERRQQSQLLAESEARFRALVEQSPLSVQVLATDGRTVQVNQAFEALWGLKLEDLANYNVLRDQQLLEAGPMPYIREAFAGKASVIPPICYEPQRNFGKGQRRWVSASIYPVKNQEGQVQRVVIVHEDITERLTVERALQDSEEHYRTLVQHAPYCIHEIGLDGCLTSMNPAGLRMMGAGSESVIRGLAYTSVICEADRGRVADLMARAFAGEQSEFEFLARNSRHFLSSFVPIRNAGGQVVRLMGLSRDITEEKEARLTTAWLAAIVESTSDGIIGLDRSGRVTSWNLGAQQILGYTSAEVLGRSVDCLVPPGAASELPEILQRVLNGENINQMETMRQHRDGRLVEVSITAAPIRGSAGEIIGISMVIGDDTERNRARQTVRLFEAAMHVTSNAVIITDPQGNIEWVNPAFSVITGYGADEAIGKNPRILKSGRQPPSAYGELWSALQNGRSWEGELVNARKDGTLYHASVTISPLRDSRGQLTHFIAIQQDISQRRLLEEELRQSQKLESIGQLAGGIAHDFNNLLTAILGNVSLVLEQTFSPAEREALLKQVLLAGQRAATLTRQLLLFSRQQKPSKSVVDLSRTAAEMGGILARTLGETIRLETDYSAQPLPVLVDAGMLGQVLLNLVVNARDAMSNGGRIVIRTGLTVQTAGTEHPRLLAGSVWRRRVGATPESQPPRLGAIEYCSLSVGDNGGGMDAAVMEKIFQPFFTTKEVGRGTGLGLATIYGIVQQHQGWIEVESKPGAGSEFTIYFPRALKEEAAVPDAADGPLQHQGGGQAVLLVEDELVVRRLISTILHRSGYRVIECESGAAALKKWPMISTEVELLITDVVMPDRVSGPMLARELCAAQPRLRVLFISGYNSSLELEREQFGDRAIFIRKPFDARELLAACQALRERP